MAELFNLKWNDFHSNVTSTFRVLRNEQYLQDVTLMTDDYQQISAHKLVLSSCSEYFQMIFRKAKQSNILLCLEGVNKNDLDNCLTYMYNGEVQISIDNLDKFLKIAQRFKLKGLQDMGDSINSTDKNYEQKAFKVEETRYEDQAIAIVHGTITEEAPSVGHYPLMTPTESKRTIVQAQNPFQSMDEADKYIENIDYNTIRCSLCGKTDMKKYVRNMRNHIETHMDGLSYKCPICDKTFRSKNSLSSHKTLYHKNY